MTHKPIRVEMLAPDHTPLSPMAALRWGQTVDSLPYQRAADETAEPTPCQSCGRAVAPASGHSYGVWRCCPGCWPVTAGNVLQGALRARGRTDLADSLADEDAELLHTVGALGNLTYSMSPTEGVLWQPPTYRQGQDHNPAPWAHVSDERLARLLADVGRLDELRAAAGLTEGPCTLGACCWCGAHESRVWHERGHRWDNGDPAPMCSGCATVYDSHESDYRPEEWDSQRGGLMQAATGVPTPMGALLADLPAYAEPAEDKYGGAPWEHVDQSALDELRWDAWAQYSGRYAPAEHRVEALARRAAKEAETERRREAAAQAERESRQVYKF